VVVVCCFSALARDEDEIARRHVHERVQSGRFGSMKPSCTQDVEDWWAEEGNVEVVLGCHCESGFSFKAEVGRKSKCSLETLSRHITWYRVQHGVATANTRR